MRARGRGKALFEEMDNMEMDNMEMDNMGMGNMGMGSVRMGHAPTLRVRSKRVAWSGVRRW